MSQSRGFASDDGIVSSLIRAVEGAATVVERLPAEIGGAVATPLLAAGNAVAHKLAVEDEMTGEIRDLQGRFERGTDTNQLRDGALYRVGPSLDRHVAAHDAPEFDRSTHVFFANGINTSSPRALAEAAALSARLDRPVDLVYVQTRGAVRDVASAYDEMMDPTSGRQNPPERTLATEIKAALDKGEDVHVIGYSRGALVTQLALDNVHDAYRSEGRSDAWIAEHVFGHVSVETFNGASHRMPAGVAAEHYVTDSDFLVGQTIGMGRFAPEIRAMSAGVIDGALCTYNALSPTQKLLEDKDFARIARDVLEFDVHTRLFPNRPDLATADLSRFQADLAKLGQDIKPPTPAFDELRRDGFVNTPNGPIRGVPDVIDRPALSDSVRLRGDMLEIVDQHDLPGAIPGRERHTTQFETKPGDLSIEEKNRVELATPERGGRGTPLPDARSIDRWDGKSHGGTMFEVDDSTYAMHVGRGDYQVFDVRRDLHGAPPASGTYVDVNQTGRVGQEATLQAHHVSR